MKNFILLLLITLFSSTVYAQSKQDFTKYGVKSGTLGEGLQVGDTAPDISGVDQHGKQVSLNSMLKQGPVAVVFYRGYWCPVCNRELKSLQNNIAMITEAGGQVLVVSPEKRSEVQKIASKVEASFPIVGEAQQVVNDYKVGFEVTDGYQEKVDKMLSIDIAEKNAADKALLPVPATFVVGQDGKVVYRQFDPNYRNRASAEDITKAIKSI